MPASTPCSNRRLTTSPPPSLSFAASSPTVMGPATSISAGTTGGGATGSGGGGGGMRSLILGIRSRGGVTAGAGAALGVAAQLELEAASVAAALPGAAVPASPAAFGEPSSRVQPPPDAWQALRPSTSPLAPTRGGDARPAGRPDAGQL